jgi:hypothetical protein
MSSDDTEAMLDTCDEHEDKLTPWEREFLDGCQDVLGHGLPLGQWRKEKLIEIYNKVKPNG